MMLYHLWKLWLKKKEKILNWMFMEAAMMLRDWFLYKLQSSINIV